MHSVESCLRRPGDYGGRSDRIEVLFAVQDFETISLEREQSGQGFIDHDADRIPVAGRGDRQASGLFGGHVGNCAEQVNAVVSLIPVQIYGQPEIQQDDSPCRCDQNIGRFNVAVEFARLVQEAQPGR